MRYVPIAALLLLNLGAGCLIYGLDDDHDGENVWMSIAPIQCMGNPWEQDWLVSHNDDYDGYPGDLSTPGLEPEEKAIIQSYYRRLGVSISRLESESWDGAVCLACSCPQGYTLFVRVPEAHEDRMIDLGFSPSDAP